MYDMMTASLPAVLRGLDPALVEEPEEGTVYLLHLDTPYRSASGYEWQHYIGHARRGYLVMRLEKHAAGQGARFLQVARAAGCTWHLARAWPGGYEREKQIKKQGGASRLCPSCGVMSLADRQQLRGPGGQYLRTPGARIPRKRLEVTRSVVRLGGQVIAHLKYDGSLITVVRDGVPAGRLMEAGGAYDAWTALHPAAATPGDQLLASRTTLRRAVAATLGL